MRGVIGVDLDRWRVVVIPGDAAAGAGQDALKAKLKAGGFKRRRTASVAGYPAGTEVWVTKREGAEDDESA